MAFKWLTLEEMVALSAAWVMADQKGRKAIEGIPELAALLPNMTKVHNALVALKTKAGPNFGAISQKEKELDTKHDDLVRGIHDGLGMMALVSEEDRESLLALRNKLLPQGLEHQQLSYRGEAGHVAVIASLLKNDDLRAQLKAIVVHKKSMLDLVETLVGYGTQLGQLEEDKARLSETSPSIRAELQTMRTRWIRMTKALITNAELAEIDTATDQLLFSALRTAEQTSGMRAPGKPAPAPTPVVVKDEDPDKDKAK